MDADVNEPGVRDQTHHASDGGNDSDRRPEVDEKLQPETAAQSREPLSRKQVLVVVLIALLVAGAVVAHLLTGPGVTH